MTQHQAEQIALEFLKAKALKAGCDLTLVDSRTMERNFGWVFFYDSKAHLETGDIRDALAGNAPFVVTRVDGRVHVTGTAHPLEQYLVAFEK